MLATLVASGKNVVTKPAVYPHHTPDGHHQSEDTEIQGTAFPRARTPERDMHPDPFARLEGLVAAGDLRLGFLQILLFRILRVAPLRGFRISILRPARFVQVFADEEKGMNSMNPPTPIKCPKCGDHSGIVSHGKRHAVYPVGCLVIGGFLIATLHQASSPTDFECIACGAKFGIRSFIAKLCLGIILLLVLWIITTVVSVFIHH
ncbi:MAG: hypothetical protein ABIT37_13625 [Luteolibacter sp.]